MPSPGSDVPRGGRRAPQPSSKSTERRARGQCYPSKLLLPYECKRPLGHSKELSRESIRIGQLRASGYVLRAQVMLPVAVKTRLYEPTLCHRATAQLTYFDSGLDPTSGLIFSRASDMPSTCLRTLRSPAGITLAMLVLSTSGCTDDGTSHNSTPAHAQSPASPALRDTPPETSPSPSALAHVDMVEEEVVGPFNSWANVRRDYGASGNGESDDTAAIQSALNDLGRQGRSEVLYFPPGTYRITQTLYLNGSPLSGPDSFGSGGVGLIGDDPATTTIKWDGPAGAPMLVQNGGIGNRYSRLTWDGSASAGIGIAQWWNTKAGVYYGADTEHQDEVFEDMDIGLMAGRLGAEFDEMDSEG
jgi:Pectate lyase superfamily protein